MDHEAIADSHGWIVNATPNPRTVCTMDREAI